MYWYSVTNGSGSKPIRIVSIFNPFNHDDPTIVWTSTCVDSSTGCVQQLSLAIFPYLPLTNPSKQTAGDFGKMHPGVLHRRFLTDLSSSLFSFVLPLLPTNEELTVKEEYVLFAALTLPACHSKISPTLSWASGQWIVGTDYRVRGLIEKLIKTIEPSARLLSFGSSCNSFGLRNSGERQS